MRLLHGIFLFSLLSLQAQASFQGLDTVLLKDAPISFFTRPCCSFANSFLQHKVGLSGLYLDPMKLESHSFARKEDEDKVGLVYTCKGGFIDVSHLRDNADWAAHILFNLPTWLGSNREVPSRDEGSFESRGVYFPEISKEEIRSLSKQDLATLAISISNSMALLHEIPTSFNIQKGSAFSVEDAYSNLLGSYLGIKGAQGDLPFNDAMTVEINNHLSSLGVLSKKETVKVHKMVKNLWWKDSFSGGFDSVLKRDFSYQGSIKPFQVSEVPYCVDTTSAPLVIPKVLSNGKSVNRYYEVRAVMKPHFQEKLSNVGLDLYGTLTQHHFPKIIETIRTHFSRKLGSDLDQNN